MLKMKIPICILVAVLAALVLAAAPVDASAAREVVVSAAASLSDAFREMGVEFEKSNPGVRVVMNFGASGTLLRQLSQGAPVDVFAVADEETMDAAEKKGLILPGTRRDFATNRLVLIQPASARAVKGLRDLLGGGVSRVAVGRPETVPAGRYARQALERAGLWDALGPKLIYAGSVRQVIDYVGRSEVDAGFVYLTDALAARGRVRMVLEPGMGPGPVRYPMAKVSGSVNGALAGRFMDYVLSGKGKATLARYGFGKK